MKSVVISSTVFRVCFGESFIHLILSLAFPPVWSGLPFHFLFSEFDFVIQNLNCDKKKKSTEMPEHDSVVPLTSRGLPLPFDWKSCIYSAQKVQNLVIFNLNNT